MPVQYKKEYSQLREQLENDVDGHYGRKPVFWLSIVALVFLCIILPGTGAKQAILESGDENAMDILWAQELVETKQQRLEWLDSIPLLGEILATTYDNCFRFITSTFAGPENAYTPDNDLSLMTMSTWPYMIGRFITTLFAQICFLVIACFPFWICAIFLTKTTFTPRASNDDKETGLSVFAQTVIFSPLHLFNQLTVFLPEEKAKAAKDWIDGIREQPLKASASISLFGSILAVYMFGSLLFSLAILAAFYAFRTQRKTAINNFDILSECTRNVAGPFYSGIRGRLVPNTSPSGNDFSAPSVACPKTESISATTNSPLYRLLEQHKAINQTNIDLLSTILAYADFPGFVPEEEFNEEIVTNTISENSETPTNSTIIKADDYTVLKSTEDNVNSVLAAFCALKTLIKNLGDEHQNFKAYRSELDSVCKDVDERTRRLLICLTPERAYAISRMPITAIITACLAQEAGKSLVFSKLGTGEFVQESKFPNLQARAVLQSLTSYHKELNSHQRLEIRRAILFSRRHCDYARAMIPSDMSAQSKGLRDWLELMYLPSEDTIERGRLVELDAHLQELANNWQKKLAEFFHNDNNTDTLVPTVEDRGLPYRTEVLVSLDNLLNLAFFGYKESKIDRIKHLIECVSESEATPKVSIRLPGLQSQNLSLGKKFIESSVSELLYKQKGGKELLKRWSVLRNALGRYNWLAGRIGNSDVPKDGLISAIISVKQDVEQDIFSSNIVPELEFNGSAAYPALVALRQRRFDFMLGADWKYNHYVLAPDEKRIKTYIKLEEYQDAAKEINSSSSRATTIPTTS